jgi:ADP-ribosylglycohydrolase
MQSVPTYVSLGMSTSDFLDRARGALLGLAVGDALGTTLEFRAPGTFEPISDMNGGGPFKLLAGQWTDDTSMALCLAHSLIESSGFSARDQMGRYLNWYERGYMSVTGRCFDIGGTVLRALGRFRETDEPFAGSTDPKSAGNGSLMRLAPIPIYYHDQLEEMMTAAADSSRVTHGAASCQDACRYASALIWGAMQGVTKQDLLAEVYEPTPGFWKKNTLNPPIQAIAEGSFSEKEPPEIKGTGYVVDCLEAALWAFAHSDSFEEGALLAVNLGDDADTTGAVFGQIAGAYYGYEGIPADWREKLAWREDLLAVVDDLLKRE